MQRNERVSPHDLPGGRQRPAYPALRRRGAAHRVARGPRGGRGRHSPGKRGRPRYRDAAGLPQGREPPALPGAGRHRARGLPLSAAAHGLFPAARRAAGRPAHRQGRRVPGARSSPAQARVPVRAGLRGRTRRHCASRRRRPERRTQPRRQFPRLPHPERQQEFDLGRAAPVAFADHLRRARRLGLPRALPALQGAAAAVDFAPMITSREIRLKSRLVGMPSAENFELVTVSVPRPGPGEVQVQNLWMTVDPYMRGRMADRASYTPSSRPGKEVPALGARLGALPRGAAIGEIAASNSTMYGWRPNFQVGETLQGGAIGEVAASDDPRFQPGDLVSSWFGWRERFNAPGGSLQKVDTVGLSPQAFLGVAGSPGLTAWVGLLKIAMPKPGDVVFVSAASGAVGSVACQIAKLKGHTVIGSAGGAAKCAFVKHIGVDHVIDYKAAGDLTEALLHVAPAGIDVYFENVGCEHLEAALAAANPFARSAICGMISPYNATELPTGPRNIMFVMGKSLRLEGYDIATYLDFMPEFQSEMTSWIQEGKVTWRETVDHGIENAPAAFLKLFKGENFGKMLVTLG